MKVSEAMTKAAKYLNKNSTALEAAKLMKDGDLGSVLIEENDKLIGMVTDRDLALKVVCEGKDPKTTKLQDIVSEKIYYCYENDDLEKALADFGKLQIHRMPVMNDKKRLVGVLSLGDACRKFGEDNVLGKTLEEISESRVA